ncbi:MAG: alpha/beta hydrolase [Rhodobacterales bacterium]
MKLRRFLKRLIYAALVVYLAAFALVWFARTALIYPFDPAHITPRQAGEPRLIEKTLTTDDGANLIVWERPAKGRKATLVYFHGNAGNLAGRAQRFSHLSDRGYGIVALAYRGSGGSTGRPSEAALSKDAILLRRKLPLLLGQAIVGKIIYYGESLGTGVAVKLATTYPPDALILEAPYTAIVDLAARQMPFFPIRAVLDQRWETSRYITQVNSPTLIIHGTDDQVVPYAMGKTLFALSPAKNNVMKTLPGAGHLPAFSGPGQTAIYLFIDGL